MHIIIEYKIYRPETLKLYEAIFIIEPWMSICHLRSKEMFSQRHQKRIDTDRYSIREKKLCIVFFRLMF